MQCVRSIRDPRGGVLQTITAKYKLLNKVQLQGTYCETLTITARYRVSSEHVKQCISQLLECTCQFVTCCNINIHHWHFEKSQSEVAEKWKWKELNDFLL